MRTENPGVWVTQEDKIASVGVHLRRNVTSHGIGLNVATDTKWFDRIVACGLPGKRTTTLRRESGNMAIEVREVAGVLAANMAEGLKGVDGVEEIREEDILRLGTNEDQVKI